MIHTGDCLEVMATLDAESIDAIVTDPPYGLEFMGKSWDKLSGTPGYVERGRITTRDVRDGTLSAYTGAGGTGVNSYQAGRPMQVWHETWAREALRVAKPGAYLLAFGGTRTVHRMTCAIEDAGWEVRDMLMWGYATGFPKSLNVGRSIDTQLCCELGAHNWNEPASDAERIKRDAKGDLWHVCPITPQGAASAGEGTALKPAWEPIVMARKPLIGTVATNVLALGTGALNIDECRIGFASDADRDASVPGTTPPSTGERGSMAGPLPRIPFSRAGETSADRRYTDNGGTNFAFTPGPRGGDAAGRWPANLILTDPILDGGWDGVVGGGEQRSGKPGTIRGGVNTGAAYGAESRAPGSAMVGFGDAGSYSRFFLIPKASRSDREPVLGGLEKRVVKIGGQEGHKINPTTGRPVVDPPRANVHPTVKPSNLMRHLVRLVTPAGGTVLDPFLGSGTTALAAKMEGFGWVGIEREAEYVAIAEARLMDRT